MLKLATDENVRGAVTRGLLSHRPGLDLVRAQDAGLRGADDPIVLASAAAEGRILITHDRATMPDFAYARNRDGRPMPGFFVINHRLSTRKAIEDLLLVSDTTDAEEWAGIVLFLPL